MAKVLKITKPDKTIHVVPVTHKAFYQHQNKVILGPSEQWTLEEIDEEAAKDLPLIDESFVTPLEATEQSKSLKKRNEALEQRIKELEEQQRGVRPMGHGQNGPVGHVGGDPATVTEGGENAGQSFVLPANIDDAIKSAAATTRVALDQAEDSELSLDPKETDKTAKAKSSKK